MGDIFENLKEKLAAKIKKRGVHLLERGVGRDEYGILRVGGQ